MSENDTAEDVTGKQSKVKDKLLDTDTNETKGNVQLQQPSTSSLESGSHSDPKTKSGDCTPDSGAEKPSKRRWKTMNEKRQHTEDINLYLKDEGYNVVEIWSCEWRAQRKTISYTNKYLYPTESKFRMTEKQILQNIMDGKIFGAIEVDIEVPTNLWEHFKELTPIFKNTIVTSADIGEHMQEYLESTKSTFHPQRYLIGSMWGKKILLITPLLKWYLEHGLKVTKIYQVIEFSPKKCFKKFADQISNDRRAG